jgi:hypothetical protein
MTPKRHYTEFIAGITMQNEEKARLEQRIIQYFDGSLNGEESKSLLADIGKSAESRALFKSHESLEHLIAASRIPMEMPMEAKRSIAERIPGLLAFIPGLLGGAEALPVITQNANPFIAFLSKIPLSTAISIGASAVVLTTAGVIVKNKMDDNAASNRKANVAIVQNNVAQPSARVYGELPKSDASIPKVAHGVADFAASSQAFRALRGSERTKGTQKTAANSANASSASLEKQSIAANNIIPESNDRSIASTPVQASHPSSDVQSAAPSFNITASPRPVPGVVADIPVIGSSIMTPFPEEDNEGITIRPYASVGERFLNVNGINGNGSTQGAQNILAGLEFELGDRYAFRVQGGRSTFAQVSSVLTAKSAFPSIPSIPAIPIYESVVVTQPAYWTTLGMSYSFAMMGSMPLILSADGGAVFTGNIGVMGILGASTEIPLMSQVVLRPSLTYDAVRTSIPARTVSNAIYQNPINETSMTSGAFGLQINLMYRF